MRRQGFGKQILLADFNETLLAPAVEELEVASYKVSSLKVDVSSCESARTVADKAASLGSVINVVKAAGVSPNMAPPARVLAVDLYGSAVVFEEFERVIAEGDSGLVVSSMVGYMLPALPKEQDHALAFTPADELLKLPFLSAEAVPNSMVAYIISKRANHLRVQASTISWGKRGARVNSISPGIVSTRLAQHAIGDMYRAMIEASPTKRMASPDEIAVAADRWRCHFRDAGRSAANSVR
jgi:NAD(P)-dependent dehydrogenase (short-subunit alcohol dehydrogenase family)